MKFNIKQFITRMSLIARLLITTICTALVLAVALITTPTTSLAAPPAQVRDGTHITIIHLNDTYEILPVSGGRLGGLARVATLKKQLLAQNPNTIMTLSGDYHGPSGMGLAKVNGVPLAGQQAVAVLNKVGIDYSTFGDHEFNIYPLNQHFQRLTETQFPIISGNVYTAAGTAYIAAPYEFALNKGALIAIFGVTKPFQPSQPGIMKVGNANDTVIKQAGAWRGFAPLVIALTHQSINDDIALATAAGSTIDLILGGDEHENMKVQIGNNPPIYKSDSNARNVYIIDLYYSGGQWRITDRLQAITSDIPEDPVVKAEVDKWQKIAFDAFRADGMEPTEVLAIPRVDLDGFGTSVRNGPTELTRQLLEGINRTTIDAGAAPDFALFTSGIIRLDDVIPAGGEFTQYDILRTFPIDVKVVLLEVKGDLLKQILDVGRKAKGTGTFLLTSRHVGQDLTGAWLINGQPIDVNRRYSVAASQIEAGNYASLGVKLVTTYPVSIRAVLAQQLKKIYPSQQ